MNEIHDPMTPPVCEALSLLGVLSTMTMSSTVMKSIDYDSSKGSVFTASVPVPQLKEGEVLIKVGETRGHMWVA